MGTMKKNVVAGLGEIGTPLYKLLSNNGKLYFFIRKILRLFVLQNYMLFKIN